MSAGKFVVPTDQFRDFSHKHALSDILSFYDKTWPHIQPFQSKFKKFNITDKAFFMTNLWTPPLGVENDDFSGKIVSTNTSGSTLNTQYHSLFGRANAQPFPGCNVIL